MKKILRREFVRDITVGSAAVSMGVGVAQSASRGEPETMKAAFRGQQLRERLRQIEAQHQAVSDRIIEAASKCAEEAIERRLPPVTVVAVGESGIRFRFD